MSNLVHLSEELPLETVEHLLAHGALWAEFSNGKSYRVRRNGATKRWKTQPRKFQIPIKMRFRDYAHISHDNLKDFMTEAVNLERV